MKGKPFKPTEAHVVSADEKTAIFVARRLMAVLEQSVKLLEAGEDVPDYLNDSARTWVAVAWTMYREGSSR